VKVFRLVSRGTIEELKVGDNELDWLWTFEPNLIPLAFILLPQYLRQVYKTQLKKETIIDVEDLERAKSKRLFRGVEGDKTRKVRRQMRNKDNCSVGYLLTSFFFTVERESSLVLRIS